MTAEMVKRRVPAPLTTERAGAAAQRADRILVPGRCRGDIEALSAHYGVPVQRGPEELKDLPRFFNRAAKPVDLSAYDTAIFAEIVDAPQLDVAAVVERARALRRDGADVIDLGCLPDTPFPHLEDCVQALKSEGFAVSVDSVDPQELLRGGRAGADYLLSLTADTLWIADEVASTPVLIPRVPADEASLVAAIESMRSRGRAFLADAILDPIPFGLTASIVRYQRLRERFPEVPIMMGIGNLTELTDADTSGINALLMGIAAELKVAAVLTTQVSAHACRAVREADWARRIMRAAAHEPTLPKGLSDALLTDARQAPVPRHARGDRRASPRRCATRTSGSRCPRPGCMSTTATACAWGRVRSSCGRSWGCRMTRRTRSTWAWNLRTPNSRGGLASAMCRISRWTGAARSICRHRI